jgi:hypothetical protein
LRAQLPRRVAGSVVRRKRLQNESQIELEIRHLHEKIDHLLQRQYNRLFEIQQIQIELLEELTRERES